MRVPTVVGIIAVCVAVSMLITTVDNRIFRRRESSVGAGDRVLDSAAPTKDSTLTPGSIDDQLWEANRLLTKARNDGETAGRLSRTWHDVLNDLKQGEGAEAIAADPQLVDKLAFLTREQRVTDVEIQSLNERIHVIQERVDGLSTDQTPLSAREMVEIRELQLVLESARVQWSRAHDQAQAIEQLAVSKMLPKRNPTLDEQLREAAAAAHVDEIERQREIAAQQDAQRRDRMQEIETKKRLEEQKQLELEQRATSPEVQAFWLRSCTADIFNQECPEGRCNCEKHLNISQHRCPHCVAWEP